MLSLNGDELYLSMKPLLNNFRRGLLQGDAWAPVGFCLGEIPMVNYWMNLKIKDKVSWKGGKPS